ncbi:MAG: ATP-binding protein [Betaproteobacteria bacterium]|nr:ATP-binding protein [Betaproteobacteria bacterium]
MWITRNAETLLRRMARQFPAVLVTGARQSGKTSLLRHVYPRASYLSLDLPAHAEAAQTAPEQLLEHYPEPVIIDEIQYAPSLLRHLKVRIDRERSKHGRYLLTGSQTFPLMQGVSESLAGRCALLSLHSLSRAEILAAGRPAEETAYVFLGGYPELHVGAEPELWFPAYVATYLERDVRNVLRVADLQEFNRFLRACALRTAQVLNYSDLARDTGVAPNTARKWLGLLQSSAVVALVEPYWGNRTKRLIKAPKLVFLDTGLAAFLAGFRSAADLFASPYAGAFWESYVFGQIVRQAAARGETGLPTYWRTAGGHEVDLVIEGGGRIRAIECKHKERPDNADVAGLRALEQAQRELVTEKIIVCRTSAPHKLADGTWVVNAADLLKRT